MRFPDLDINSKEIRRFQNPFDCNVTEIPTQFQIEIIDLQANVQIKDKYNEGNDFYKYLNAKEFPNLKQFACKFISLFGSNYMCEQTFSRMMYLNQSTGHIYQMIIYNHCL